MSRRIKAEKGARESTARRSQRADPEDVTMADPRDEAPEDDEAAELERVLATIANYPDQPLDAGQEAKLRMAASEISAHNNLYTTAFEDLQDTATMLAEAIPTGENVFENEASEPGIRESLLKLIDKQHMAELYVDALDTDIRKPVAGGRPIVDPVTVFDEGVEKRSETYKSQTARQKYAKAKAFATFVEGVWEAYQPDEGRPAITEFLPRGESHSRVKYLELTFLTEAGDAEDSDEEMEVGGVTQDYKCPLTLQIYTDPLTSTVCGHSFSAVAIREYVRNNDKCPAQGCNAKISPAVLKQDKALAKKAQAAKRRAQRDEEDDDDDDIDD